MPTTEKIYLFLGIFFFIIFAGIKIYDFITSNYFETKENVSISYYDHEYRHVYEYSTNIFVTFLINNEKYDFDIGNVSKKTDEKLNYIKTLDNYKIDVIFRYRNNSFLSKKRLVSIHIPELALELDLTNNYYF